jgi:transcriptional regulator with XRE-family HTH domain
MADLLTGREIAAKLRVTPRLISMWANDGTIPCIRISRKVFRYDLDAVIAAVGNRRQATIAELRAKTDAILAANRGGRTDA